MVAHVLLGHTHWDHIQGFPFFTPAFVKGNSVAVHGPEGSGGSLRKVLPKPGAKDPQQPGDGTQR